MNADKPNSPSEVLVDEDPARPHYEGLQGQRYHQSKRSIPEVAFPWIAQLRAKKIASQIRPTDVVLEYGVGLGWNLAALKCARKIGLDVGEFLGPLVRERGIEFVTDPRAIPKESIDAVVCHHTLEHAWQPTLVLSTIYQMLRPEGRLLLFVPYEKERRFRTFNLNEPNHHLYCWNVQTLGNPVQEAGFQVKSAALGRFGQERFAALLAVRLHLGQRTFGILHWLANTLKNECEVRVLACKSGGRSRSEILS